MNTSPKDQAALLFDAARPIPRQPAPGEYRWSIRKKDGLVLVCELRSHGDLGTEVQLLRDGEFLFGQRWPTRELAEQEAAALLQEHLDKGGTQLAR